MRESGWNLSLASQRPAALRRSNGEDVELGVVGFAAERHGLTVFNASGMVSLIQIDWTAVR